MAAPPIAPAIDWKALREWIAIGVSVLALILAIVSALYSAKATDIEQRRFDEDHGVTVLFEQDKSDKTGLTFHLRAQDNARQLQDIGVDFPTKLRVGHLAAVPGGQTLYLYMIRQDVIDLCVGKFGRGRVHPRRCDFAIPMVFDVMYAMRGDSYTKHGVYLLRGTATVQEMSSTTSDSITIDNILLLRSLDDVFTDKDRQGIIDETPIRVDFE